MQLEISSDYVAQLNPLVPISKYPSLFRNIDIGIAPLRDIPFNHAKSYIKGLEYAAAGIPFIATDIAEYSSLAASGVGRVASTKDEWIYHLDELLNTSKRKDEIEVNYENLQNFTMEKRGADWNATFHHMLKNL